VSAGSLRCLARNEEANDGQSCVLNTVFRVRHHAFSLLGLRMQLAHPTASLSVLAFF
jgi:hypothetical protein